MDKSEESLENLSFFCHRYYQDEEDLAEANEKRGIVTRGEYFSSSRYSSRRSSAVTTPGEPEEGFCRFGPRMKYLVRCVCFE